MLHRMLLVALALTLALGGPAAQAAGTPSHGTAPPLSAAADSTARGVNGTGVDLSTLKDARHSLDIGLRWLDAQQQEDGAWSLGMYPALTALAVMAYCMDPRREPNSPLPPAAQKGVDYLLKCVQPDGGIYIPSDKAPSLPYYNTALALSALALTGDARYQPVMEKARAKLIGGQHLGPDVFNGGFGYEEGTQRSYADLSNTYMVLEAMRVSETSASKDASKAPLEKKLNWDAALQFVTRVQNLPGFNDMAWAQSPRPDDLGGFIYHPGESKAGDEPGEEASRRFHSYGSMSYAGLLSFIYAEVDRTDPRVLAAVDWIRRHYTVDENPGMGVQGMYYNFHTMSKALAQWGESPLVLSNGKAVWWRKDLAVKLVTLQRIDPKTGLGYWMNENNRWWETDPVLATSYALIALEIAVKPAVRS